MAKQIVSAPKTAARPAVPPVPPVPSVVIAKGRGNGPAAPPAPVNARPATVPASDASAKEIANLKAQLAKLTETLASVKKRNTSAGRTVAEILGQTEEEKAHVLSLIGADDWRAPYQGTGADGSFFVREFGFTNEQITVADDAKPVSVFLAIPRDNDMGKAGAKERNGGRLAVHYNRAEDGSFIGTPAYVTLEELGAIWIHEAPKAVKKMKLGKRASV